MKTLFLFFSICFNLDVNATSELKTEPSSIYNQLINLNPFWKDRNVKDEILNQIAPIKTDVDLIQFHLRLVETELRKIDCNHLTVNQKKNRLQALEILSQYWQKGQFPINSFHGQRTPYFIDKYGTACAVGHMIISTGYGELAKKVSRKNNYAYIKQLHYFELGQWANKFGFTIDELAWIQPTYLDPTYGDTGCAYNAKIYLTNSNKIFKIRWSNGDTTLTANSLCPKTYYSCKLWDSLGSLYSDSFYRISSSFGIQTGDSIYIPEIKPFYIKLSSAPDDGTCNGSVSAKVLIGDTSQGVGYYWFSTRDTNRIQKHLCEGFYKLAVSLKLGSMQNAIIIDSIKVLKGFLPISNGIEIEIKLFPNPASSYCEVILPENIDAAEFEIYNASGSKLLAKTITSQNQHVILSHLNKGLYYYSIIMNHRSQKGKIMIH
jgi:hypothetical protein